MLKQNINSGKFNQQDKAVLNCQYHTNNEFWVAVIYCIYKKSRYNFIMNGVAFLSIFSMICVLV